MNKEDYQTEGYGFIVPFIKKVFRFLQALPPQRFLGNRSDFNNSINTLPHDKFKAATQKRSIKVERFMICNIMIEIFLIILIAFGCISKESHWIIQLLSISFCFLEYINIIQVSVNMTLFDSSRSQTIHVTASYVRNLILLLINYIEIALLFGITYAIIPWGSISGFKLWTDNFYFSFITQLTIGYGDLEPVGIIKLLSVFQGLTTFYFTIMIIGRFIGLMPKITEVDKKDKVDS